MSRAAMRRATMPEAFARAMAEIRELRARIRLLEGLVDRAAENAYETPANRRDEIPLGELRYELRAALRKPLPRRKAGR